MTRSSHILAAALLSVLTACVQTTPNRAVRVSETRYSISSPATTGGTSSGEIATPWSEESSAAGVERLAASRQEEGGEPQKDQTGTDPRDFSTKFMPYYRYTELENGVEEHNMTAFGLVAFSKDVALTYEVPIAMERDFSDVGAGSQGAVGGMGDANIRMFKNWGRWAGMDWMWGFQLTFPTGTQDALTSGQFQAGPIIVNVVDIPKMHAFFAMMHIYQTDLFGDDNGDDVAIYIGRWFWMQPLTKPGPGAFDGIYLLPEVQPIYDFENSDFSFWIAPELGQIIGEGKVLYLKPGWGIEAEGAERKNTFEFGFRWFF